MEHLTLSDGRTLEYLVEGPASAIPLVLHHGTPSGTVRYAPLVDAAVAGGFRFVQASRPGYATSTPHPGRRVADAAADTAALMDALDAPAFVTLGWSGGGPHALACAALLPGRCRAAATIAGVAPYDAKGLNWLAGMGEENVQEFGAALAGPEALDAFLVSAAAGMADVKPADLVEAFGDLISEVDKRTLAGGLADYLAASFHAALSTGVAGWRDDDQAFVADWGFRPEDVAVPVSLWQGDQDRMVPFAHGGWLAEHLPTAESHLVPGEGHLSLLSNLGTIVDDLRRLAG
ncbi:alpha/beta hydrolase [Actinoplanes sp. KI2]|uniref:alpha/beta fold hydrolase n=1 Tax=Actinoplanes sp. KI2 TaxID=2983315 RepID=UPI0021D5A11E|nr:alpha/beta hydrolase [Actinoplanes sp. KI2]MCU7725546.1 alpha/beta hydrolase [Actinoplanes sp. KI2]